MKFSLSFFRFSSEFLFFLLPHLLIIDLRWDGRQSIIGWRYFSMAPIINLPPEHFCWWCCEMATSESLWNNQVVKEKFLLTNGMSLRCQIRKNVECENFNRSFRQSRKSVAQRKLKAKFYWKFEQFFFCFSQQNFLVKLKALFRCLRSRQQALQEDEGWFGGTTRKIWFEV